MKIICDKCKSILEIQGALIFSPPTTMSAGVVTLKYHLCNTCYVKLMTGWIDEKDNPNR